MKAFQDFQGKAIVLPRDHVDTDQIIPARYLDVTSSSGLGKYLFSNWRYLKTGAENPEFILNQAESIGAEILVAGENFGCGSSREHAPWAIKDWGIRVVVSCSFADIFYNNCIKNGILPVEVSKAFYQELRQYSWLELSVSLKDQSISLSNGSCHNFAIDAFAKHCLQEGKDQLDFIFEYSDRISKFEEARLWN